MQFASIDIETTGINYDMDQILEIGICLIDTKNYTDIEKCPQLNLIVSHERYQGSAFAINMNQRLFKILAGQEKADDVNEYRKQHNIVRPNQIGEILWQFFYIHQHGELDKFDGIIAGGYMSRHNFFGEDLPAMNNRIPKIFINPIGKNFDKFDRNFLKMLPQFNKFILMRRSADPSVFFADYNNDSTLPNLKTCMDRSKVFTPDRIVTHEALQDAKDTAVVFMEGIKKLKI